MNLTQSKVNESSTSKLEIINSHRDGGNEREREKPCRNLAGSRVWFAGMPLAGRKNYFLILVDDCNILPTQDSDFAEAFEVRTGPYRFAAQLMNPTQRRLCRTEKASRHHQNHNATGEPTEAPITRAVGRERAGGTPYVLVISSSSAPSPPSTG